MSVKVRKVGNSMVLTVPSYVAESLGVYEGQEYSVDVVRGGIEYSPVETPVRNIDWNKYDKRGRNLRDGMTPEEYVRRLRDDDR